MNGYTLNVKVDPIIAEEQSKNNLNIARKVNGVYTTTFHGASFKPVGSQQKLLENNKFQWTERYAVFLSVQYKAGMQVSAATDPREISFGQKTAYAKSVLTKPEPADSAQFQRNDAAQSFLLCEDPDDLMASVSCKVKDKWATIYVDNEKHNSTMNKELSPKQEYIIFWDSYVITESMIDYYATSRPYDFKFGSDTEKTLRFGYETPNKKKSIEEQAMWYPA